MLDSELKSGIRRNWHNNEWHLPVIEALTDSPRQYLGVLKGKESQLLTFYLQLKLLSAEEKESAILTAEISKAMKGRQNHPKQHIFDALIQRPSKENSRYESKTFKYY